MQEAVSMQKIVVGVDGPAESTTALEVALTEARLRGAEVGAVHVCTYTLPDIPDSDVTHPERILHVIASAERRAGGCIEEAVVAAGARAKGIPVTREVVRDREPAKVLVDLAKDADLLVVGSRGRGGFAGLLLGSVAQKCVHHARCPVMVVPRQVR
jgi:nucleotide-binding universal stress UspA family protein